jgi:hypothetical protein
MSLKDANPVNPKKPKRVAIVISNPAISTTTGWPVGFWWSELAHPYFAFVGSREIASKSRAALRVSSTK